MLVGCASGPGSKSGQRNALKDLEQGRCPTYIIYPGQRSDYGRTRYDHEATDAQLGNYRDREVANCRALAARGDADATRVLAEYGYVDHKPREIVAAYSSYLVEGTDQALLAEAATKLYRSYSTGEGGVRRDSALAFRYMGLAVKYGVTAYEYQYANALYARGLYADALPYLRVMATGEGDREYTKEQTCEMNLKLADMYFRGRGMKENWYIGYYYWLQGLSLAGDPDFGSCIRNAFIGQRDLYARDQERKAAIDRRLGYLGATELKRVRTAREERGDEALDYIADLDFKRPYMSGADKPIATRSPSVVRSSIPWPSWKPLNSPICRMTASAHTVKWSDVFRMRSGAIWTVRSSAGKSESVGTAVAIAPNRLVTNCHLMQLPGGVKLAREGLAMVANVVSADREGDRCVLQTAKPLPSYVAFAKASNALPIGEDVAAIGNPKGLNTSLSRGIVAQKRQRNGHTYIQTDTAISSGSSGGGLFDTAGNLVGITTFKVAAGESLNFAIAIDEFCR